jgi:threonine synthase
MGLESAVVKTVDFPEKMNWKLVEKWAEIPLYPESDPEKPEWKETPVIEADLSKYGYGLVHIKNEADTTKNPTGTIKDRLAWELATLYRDFALDITLENNERGINGNIEDIPVPRLSVITSGNIGRAVERVFAQYELPPPSLLIPLFLPDEKLEALKKLRANIVAADLSQKPLVAEDVQTLTGNPRGMEITSFMGIKPEEVFYDWHVHEVFNQKPDEIFVPYGSGRLMENFLTWQWRSRRNAVQGTPDKRLKIPVHSVTQMDVFGAEPEKEDSIADKLTKTYNPFVIYKEPDIEGIKTFRTTGGATGVYKATEQKIEEAHKIMNEFCPAEPSGAAGLALYMQRHEQGLVNPKQKIIVVNTGKGI